jgi:hypothetical protein
MMVSSDDMVLLNSLATTDHAATTLGASHYSSGGLDGPLIVHEEDSGSA